MGLFTHQLLSALVEVSPKGVKFPAFLMPCSRAREAPLVWEKTARSREAGHSRWDLLACMGTVPCSRGGPRKCGMRVNRLRRWSGQWPISRLLSHLISPIGRYSESWDQATVRWMSAKKASNQDKQYFNTVLPNPILIQNTVLNTNILNKDRTNPRLHDSASLIHLTGNSGSYKTLFTKIHGCQLSIWFPKIEP